MWLAAALPGGVIGQAVVGGIVVLTKLNPAWVAVHFLLSTAILGAAVILHVRCGEGDGPATPVVRRDLRLMGAVLVPVVAVMFAAGTVVTGTGQLAGNADGAALPPAVHRRHPVPRGHRLADDRAVLSR